MVLAVGIALDLLSFIGWSDPALTTVITLSVITVVAIGAFIDIRIGVAAVLLELLWGSHGHLLRVATGGPGVSLRICLFLVVMSAAVWHLRTFGARHALWSLIRIHPVRWLALAFLLTLGLAGILGMIRHPIDRVFFDANAWGFLALAPAFLIAAASRANTANHSLIRTNTRMVVNERGVPSNDVGLDSCAMLLCGASYLILRFYALLFLFSHDLGGTWMPLYQWVRDTRLGEVTIFFGAFPRIFLPSMVLLFPVVLLAGLRTMRISQRLEGKREGEGNRMLTISVFGGGIAVLLLSLSRSYWMGFAALGTIGIAWGMWSWLRSRHSPIRMSGRMVSATIVLVGSVAVMSLLAMAIVRLPYPPPLTTAGFTETFIARFQQDAAVANRWQEIGPLRSAIGKHLAFGNGFGAAVTYETKDPRTLAAYPNGRYTTTAFEWGYLDDLLERGYIGLLAELWFIGALIWHGFRQGGETAALALGLLAIAVVHATSPYLNHPLGIGIMLLLFAYSTEPLEIPNTTA